MILYHYTNPQNRLLVSWTGSKAGMRGGDPLAIQIAITMLDADQTLTLAIHDDISNAVVLAAHDPIDGEHKFAPWRNPRPTQRIVHRAHRRTQ